MTQALETPRKVFDSLSGGETELDYSDTFTAGSTGTVKVLKNGVDLLSSAYTVDIDTGVVTLDSAVASSSDVYVVYRSTPIQNTASFTNTTNPNAATLDSLIDNQIRILQELKDKIDRSIKYNESVDLTTADLTLPVPVEGEAIGWDEDDNLVNIEV